MNLNQPTHPSFQNLELQKAISEATPTFDSYFNLLDKISRDIEGLESYLLGKGITTEARWCFFDGEQCADYIEWGYDEGSQKFRLQHAVYVWRAGGTDGDKKISDKQEGRVKSKNPLIESPTEVRVRSFQALPNLIESLRLEIERIKGSFQMAPATPVPAKPEAKSPKVQSKDVLASTPTQEVRSEHVVGSTLIEEEEDLSYFELSNPTSQEEDNPTDLNKMLGSS